MVNKIQEGNLMDVVLTSVVASGGVVELHDFVGVAVSGGKAGDNISVAFTGVYALPKTAGVGDGILQGTKVYWDAANSVITATAGALKIAGYVWETAQDGDTTVNVRLLG